MSDIFAFGIVFGFVAGVLAYSLFSYLWTKRSTKDSYVGDLIIAPTDEGPAIFLELSRDVSDLEKKDAVIMKVKHSQK